MVAKTFDLWLRVIYVWLYYYRKKISENIFAKIIETYLRSLIGSIDQRKFKVSKYGVMVLLTLLPFVSHNLWVTRIWIFGFPLPQLLCFILVFPTIRPDCDRHQIYFCSVTFFFEGRKCFQIFDFCFKW